MGSGGGENGAFKNLVFCIGVVKILAAIVAEIVLAVSWSGAGCG